MFKQILLDKCYNAIKKGVKSIDTLSNELIENRLNEDGVEILKNMSLSLYKLTDTVYDIQQDRIDAQGLKDLIFKITRCGE